MSTPRQTVQAPAAGALLACLLLCAAGCRQGNTCPRVIFLDGAGWYTGDRSVRAGLSDAGFPGPVERFGWTSLLGALPDHLLASGSHPRVVALADRLTALRRANPQGRIAVISLSAGASIVVPALARLPEDVSVDFVVLLSPSISSRHDLSGALRHVKRRLYATCSPHDRLLAVSGSSGLESGRPAGQVGFRPPEDNHRDEYRKLVTLDWQPAYAAYGWNGGHVSATSREFISTVIAPRIMDDLPHPLDRPMLAGKDAAP